MTVLETQGLAAKNAARRLAVAASAQKDAALEAIAGLILLFRSGIINSC